MSQGGGFETFHKLTRENHARVKANFEHIFKKYDRAFSDCDEVDWEDLSIISKGKNGKASKLSAKEFGRAKLKSTGHKDVSVQLRQSVVQQREATMLALKSPNNNTGVGSFLGSSPEESKPNMSLLSVLVNDMLCDGKEPSDAETISSTSSSTTSDEETQEEENKQMQTEKQEQKLDESGKSEVPEDRNEAEMQEGVHDLDSDSGSGPTFSPWRSVRARALDTSSELLPRTTSTSHASNTTELVSSDSALVISFAESRYNPGTSVHRQHSVPSGTQARSKQAKAQQPSTPRERSGNSLNRTLTPRDKNTCRKVRDFQPSFSSPGSSWLEPKDAVNNAVQHALNVKSPRLLKPNFLQRMSDCVEISDDSPAEDMHDSPKRTGYMSHDQNSRTPMTPINETFNVPQNDQRPRRLNLRRDNLQNSTVGQPERNNRRESMLPGMNSKGIRRSQSYRQDLVFAGRENKQDGAYSGQETESLPHPVCRTSGCCLHGSHMCHSQSYPTMSEHNEPVASYDIHSAYHHPNPSSTRAAPPASSVKVEPRNNNQVGSGWVDSGVSTCASDLLSPHSQPAHSTRAKQMRPVSTQAAQRIAHNPAQILERPASSRAMQNYQQIAHSPARPNYKNEQNFALRMDRNSTSERNSAYMNSSLRQGLYANQISQWRNGKQKTHNLTASRSIPAMMKDLQSFPNSHHQINTANFLPAQLDRVLQHNNNDSMLTHAPFHKDDPSDLSDTSDLDVSDVEGNESSAWLADSEPSDGPDNADTEESDCEIIDVSPQNNTVIHIEDSPVENMEPPTELVRKTRKLRRSQQQNANKPFDFLHNIERDNWSRPEKAPSVHRFNNSGNSSHFSQNSHFTQTNLLNIPTDNGNSTERTPLKERDQVRRVGHDMTEQTQRDMANHSHFTPTQVTSYFRSTTPRARSKTPLSHKHTIQSPATLFARLKMQSIEKQRPERSFKTPRSISATPQIESPFSPASRFAELKMCSPVNTESMIKSGMQASRVPHVNDRRRGSTHRRASHQSSNVPLTPNVLSQLENLLPQEENAHIVSVTQITPSKRPSSSSHSNDDFTFKCPAPVMNEDVRGNRSTKPALRTPPRPSKKRLFDDAVCSTPAKYGSACLDISCISSIPCEEAQSLKEKASGMVSTAIPPEERKTRRIKNTLLSPLRKMKHPTHVHAVVSTQSVADSDEATVDYINRTAKTDRTNQIGTRIRIRENCKATARLLPDKLSKTPVSREDPRQIKMAEKSHYYAEDESHVNPNSTKSQLQTMHRRHSKSSTRVSDNIPVAPVSHAVLQEYSSRKSLATLNAEKEARDFNLERYFRTAVTPSAGVENALSPMRPKQTKLVKQRVGPKTSQSRKPRDRVAYEGLNKTIESNSHITVNNDIECVLDQNASPKPLGQHLRDPPPQSSTVKSSSKRRRSRTELDCCDRVTSSASKRRRKLDDRECSDVGANETPHIHERSSLVSDDIDEASICLGPDDCNKTFCFSCVK